MKICPRCDQPMLDAASRCVRCGYETRETGSDDFPARRPPLQRDGWAYSSFARLTLQLSTFLTGLAVALALVLAIIWLFQGEWLRVLAALLAAWGNFASFVVLQRVSDLD